MFAYERVDCTGKKQVEKILNKKLKSVKKTYEPLYTSTNLKRHNFQYGTVQTAEINIYLNQVSSLSRFYKCIDISFPVKLICAVCFYEDLKIERI